jgi:hypothetical protein
MSTARLYFEAVVAISIMLTLSVISGFLAAAVSDSRTAVMVAMAVVFVATGAILLLRVWLSAEAGRSDQADV